MKKLFFIIFLCILYTTIFPDRASSQKILANLDFETRFDNREYGSEFAGDQTIFGIKIRPEVGVRWWENNRLMLGGDFTLDFGAQRDKRNPELILYYGYEGERFRAYTGILQRDKVLGDYSPAFFSDSVKFYDSNIEGALLQYSGRRGFIEAGFDWNSMISKVDREKFMIFSAARIHYRKFYAGYQASMYHFSSSYEEGGVVDNVLAYPHAGFIHQWQTRKPMHITIRAGWLQALQKDRQIESSYRTPGGFQAELNYEWNRIGFKETLYAGKNLMPYYDRYGPGLYMGESFYRTTKGIYNRIELYWRPISNQIFNLELSSIHHYDGNGWGSQQLVSFKIKLDAKTVRSRNK